MLIGLKDKDREALRLSRALLTKISGFSLIEILVTVLILVVIFSGLFFVLNIGRFSSTTSSEKLELQEQVRRVTDWIVKDVRQTVAYQIANNQPSSTHIKFKVCLGHDGNDRIWSDDFIEYTYDSDLNRLIRADYDTGQIWNFDNIIAEPFDIGAVSSNNALVVTITGQRQRIGLPNMTSTLTANIKIRNE